jgi:hypothetical protein
MIIATTVKKQTNNHKKPENFQTADVSTVLLSVPLAVNGTTIDLLTIYVVTKAKRRHIKNIPEKGLCAGV